MRLSFEPVLDWIYPPRCELCMRIGRPAICEDCMLDFQELEDHVTFHVHGSALDVSAAIYSFETRAAQAVKRLKYERATALARPMSRLVSQARESLELPDFELTLPVPIHWRRRCTRGFNQSELLSESLIEGHIDRTILRRVRSTRPQVGLTKAERLRNLKGAFLSSDQANGKRVLLIDDVTTTGGTGIACAEALKAAGASYVGLLAFCGEL